MQKNKELKLKDLCSRLLYGVNIHIVKTRNSFIYEEKDTTLTPNSIAQFVEDDNVCVFAYLRPMDSMTHKEYDEYLQIKTHKEPWALVEWLDRNMFDHRKTDKGKTMIKAGLALEATADMYNEKK